MHRQRVGIALSAAAIWLMLAACEPTERGTVIGSFVSDKAIQSVRECETSEKQLLRAFGPPSGRGREGGFRTYTWQGVAGARDARRAKLVSQTVIAWVDASGRVAQLTINPASMPTPPKQACAASRKASAKRD